MKVKLEGSSVCTLCGAVNRFILAHLVSSFQIKSVAQTLV